MPERLLLKYRLLEEVGQGGMAVVYRGLDTTLNREVAVKILHSHLAEQAESKQRFQREAHAVAKLRHDNIIEIYDYSGLDSPESYIVTEFIHGQTLKEYLSRHPISHPEVAAMIIIEVLAALEHAHAAGVIHRDIKPENIMIRDDGRVKLTDFGIAQVIDVQRLTVTGQLLGSPAYMAPELVEGKQLDFRSDVFSVGVLLYQLATSELPFKGKNPHEVLKRISDCRYVDPEVANPVVGSRLARIIRKALAHDQEARYQNVHKLHEDLAAYLADVGVTDPREELARYFQSPKDYSGELQERIVRSLTENGKTALQAGKTPLALECFNRILCVDPRNQEVLALLGRITRRRRAGRGLAVLALAGAMGTGAYLLASRWPSATAGGADAAAPVKVSRPDPRELDARAAGADDSRMVASPGGKLKLVRASKLLPMLSRQIEIIPTPKAVSVWLNDKRLGDYGPDLRRVMLPFGTTAKLTFRNEACCYERVVTVGSRADLKTLRVRLPWKPARVRVELQPAVEADVQVGAIVARAGQPIEVPIPSYSEDGQDEVEVKVSAAGYSTESRKVRIRANVTAKVEVALRRLAP